DVRDALERASARHTAVHVAAGAVAKTLLAAIGVSVAGEAVPEHGADPAAVDEARKARDTLGGTVVVRAQGVPPGLGSYARKDDRLDARLAATLMGIQAVKSVEIGDGKALASLRGSDAHDEINPDRTRKTNRAGDIDRETEALAGRSIPELFAEDESVFREWETRAIEQALAGPPALLDLGGGAVRSPALNGVAAVWIDTDVDTCWRRVRGSDRPLA